jgi:xylulokinase
MELLLGVDVGTQGTRAVITDILGNILAKASRNFRKINCSDQERHKEQNPYDWWEATTLVVRNCISQLEQKGESKQNIKALSVDATSGTVLAIGEDNIPNSPGILYNDSRSAKEAEEISEYAERLEGELGYKVNASFGLPKILYLSRSGKSKNVRYLHQGDFIIGMLTGEFGVTDYSNALKTCYDLRKKCWPEFLALIGIKECRLPKVVAPGTPIAHINKRASEETGLSERTVVVAGATDGYASALAAGISEAGDWASIIGTTLVIKGITKELVIDEKRRIYSHLHPQGWWLIGGASNVGGKCLNDLFDTQSFSEMNRLAAMRTPTGISCYPLFEKGERFPFINAHAEGFINGEVKDDKDKYTVLLEGIGYAERLSFEMLEKMGCEVGKEIYTCGGACKSKEWLQIRSDILQKTLIVPELTDAVMGTALLASLAVAYPTLKEASLKMIRISKSINPSDKAGRYEESYQNTLRELIKRGYIE